MLMVVPYQVEVVEDRWPIANYVVVGVTGILSILWLALEGKLDFLMLDGWGPGLMGYFWVQEGIFLLILNVLFLWLFGNAVAAKVGHIAYLPLYVGLGATAGAIHVLCGGGAAIGSNGAICGLVGLYLVLYPSNMINCIYIVIVIIRSFSMGGVWLVVVWAGLNLWGSSTAETGLVVWGQLGVFGMGVLLGAIMLKFGLVQIDVTEKTLFDFLGWKVKKSGKDWSEVKEEGKEWMGKDIMKKEGKADVPGRQLGTMKADKPPEKPVSPLVDSKSIVEAGETQISSALDKRDGIIRFKCTCGKSIKA
ncbi:MAG: rhomboid family intramembrane serine protease, partial [Planctomycetes bacterium]|nr:rhomboid family intramembrane serine protease [Planctomycetota bacterium]